MNRVACGGQSTSMSRIQDGQKSMTWQISPFFPDGVTTTPTVRLNLVGGAKRIEYKIAGLKMGGLPTFLRLSMYTAAGVLVNTNQRRVLNGVAAAAIPSPGITTASIGISPLQDTWPGVVGCITVYNPAPGLLPIEIHTKIDTPGLNESDMQLVQDNPALVVGYIDLINNAVGGGFSKGSIEVTAFY